MGLSDWFKRETPQEQVRRWQRTIRGEMRGVDRQITDIKRELKKTELSIKECAKRGDKRSMNVLALELLRTRKAVERLHTSKAQMNSITLHLNENLAVGHMKSSGELMTAMNNVIKTSVVAKTMMELSKEMFKAGVIDEMVGDAMGSALDAEDMEEETEAEVQKVLNELAVDAVKIMPAAGRARAPAVTAPAVEAPEEEEAEGEAISGLQARLDAIRAL